MSKKPAKQAPKARASSGAQSVSVYLLPEERALWDGLATELKMSKKDVFVDALRAMRATLEERADIPAELRRLANELEKRK